MDLDSYFTRIGYTGSHKPGAGTLRDIHVRHARAIPFENIDVILRRHIALDEASLERKLVRERRGGYCFEHGHLFMTVLRQLGFEVAPLIGRVRPQGATALGGLTHMLLRVVADGKAYLADTGFGGLSLAAPLLLEMDTVQSDSAIEPRRLKAQKDLIVHQALVNGAWSDVYLFSPEEAPPIDFEVGNWYTSTHPQSRFIQNLAVARMDDGCRHSLLNREYTVRRRGAEPETTAIDSPGELLATLDRAFGLKFPPGTRFGSPGSPWPT